MTDTKTRAPIAFFAEDGDGFLRRWYPPALASAAALTAALNELHLMKTAGIIEVAVRNPSVSEYMGHWEGRADKAEAERDELDALLNEGIATDADTRMQAEERGRVAGLRKAAKRYRDGGDWDVFATADCAILDLIPADPH